MRLAMSGEIMNLKSIALLYLTQGLVRDTIFYRFITFAHYLRKVSSSYHTFVRSTMSQILYRNIGATNQITTTLSDSSSALIRLRKQYHPKSYPILLTNIDSFEQLKMGSDKIYRIILVGMSLMPTIFVKTDGVLVLDEPVL